MNANLFSACGTDSDNFAKIYFTMLSNPNDSTLLVDQALSEADNEERKKEKVIQFGTAKQKRNTVNWLDKQSKNLKP